MAHDPHDPADIVRGLRDHQQRGGRAPLTQKRRYRGSNRRSVRYPCHNLKQELTEHETVHHRSGEYVRGDVSTNTIEGPFDLFKRGMVGTYQHCGVQYLQCSQIAEISDWSVRGLGSFSNC